MNSLFASGLNISIAPETLFHIGPVIITNAQMLGILGTAILLAILFSVRNSILKGGRGRFMHLIMWLFESLYDTTVEVIGNKKVAQKVLPLAATLMLFFMFNNWLGLLPVVGSITYHTAEGTVPLFRGVAADMNTTFALAIISMVTAQLWAIKRRGVRGNLHRYFVNPFKDPMHAFEGILEFVAEFSRTGALGMRIFGNVFGGEVLLGVIGYLTAYASPLALPIFYCLELFVGAVQAYVFFMLTIAFISLGLPEAEDAHGEHEAAALKQEGLEEVPTEKA
jgi:F-type H+-transporting ATPase subunit a